MKNIILLLALLLLVAHARAVTVTGTNENVVVEETVVTTTTTATHLSDSAPNNLPISEGARKAYLLSRSVTATIRYVGEGLVRIPGHTGERTFSFTGGTGTSGTPAALLANLANQRVSIGIANPHRPVTATCELLDSSNNILLRGEAAAEVIPDQSTSGGYRIVQSGPIVLQSVSNISLSIPGATSIDINVRDEQGNLNYTNTMHPNNGMFDIWTWSYRYGEVVVNFEDGSQAFYSFTTGERQQAVVSDSQTSLVIPNYVEQTIVMPSACNTVRMDSTYTNGQTPSPEVFRVKVLASTRLRFVVSCREAGGAVVAPPTEWWYHRDGDEDEVLVPEFESYDIVTGTAAFNISVTPGVYWINADGPQFRTTFWNWTGGKG